MKQITANVIVSGLKEEDGVSDCDMFSALCEENLSIKPAVVSEKSRRIGKKQTDKPRLFLVVLHSEDSAQELLRVARQLRKSDDSYVQHNVYINADLTRAEAQLVYERRVARRLQHQHQINEVRSTQSAKTAIQHDNSTGSRLSDLSPDAPAFHLPSTSTSGAASVEPCL